MNTSMVSTVTINGKFFAVCSFSQWSAREGSPGRTCAIESNHGREKGRTPFARTGVDKRLDRNCGCDILLMYDPWRLTLQSPAGQGAGLGSRIGNQVGRLNTTHA